jgi:hypothetical protein
MKRNKFYALSYFLLITLLLPIFRIPYAKAEEETTTTFPVGEAGIAAYVKLDSVTIEDLTEALNHYYTREKQTETYVIGTVEVVNKFWKNYPHLYISLDGWMVAYYLKDEEASKIMQWKDYTPGSITTTTLKDVIDFMAESIGVTYSTEVKYYNFEFPEANKMTLIAETLPQSTLGYCKNGFSVTVPGTLYEASYSIYAVHWGYDTRRMNLNMDNEIIFTTEVTQSEEFYGFYDLTDFEVNVPHFIELSRYNCNGEGAATVLIYHS